MKLDSHVCIHVYIGLYHVCLHQGLHVGLLTKVSKTEII